MWTVWLCATSSSVDFFSSRKQLWKKRLSSTEVPRIKRTKHHHIEDKYVSSWHEEEPKRGKGEGAVDTHTFTHAVLKTRDTNRNDIKKILRMAESFFKISFKFHTETFYGRWTKNKTSRSEREKQHRHGSHLMSHAFISRFVNCSLKKIIKKMIKIHYRCSVVHGVKKKIIMKNNWITYKLKMTQLRAITFVHCTKLKLKQSSRRKQLKSNICELIYNVHI